MTPRERTDKLLRGIIPDRMGIHEWFWGETLPAWQGQGYPENTDPNLYFGLHLHHNFSINVAPLPDEQTLEETEETRVFRDSFGATVRYWKHRSGVPEHLGFDVTTPARWQEYKRMLNDPARNWVQIEDYRNGKIHAEKHQRYYVTGGLLQFELLRRILGDVCMLESMALEPDWILDFCDTYADFYIRHFKTLFTEAGKPDGIFFYEDMGYNKGPFCSPKMSRELIAPSHKKIFDFLHENDLPVIVHSCGGISPLVGDMIWAGMDCLQGIEFKAGNDVVELAKTFGDKIAFMGNINVQILETHDPDVITEHVTRKIQALKKLSARYFVMSDHSIPPSVRWSDYQLVHDLWRKMGTYD